MEKFFVLKSIIYDMRFDSSVFFESNPIYFRVTDKTYRKMSRYDKIARCRPCKPCRACVPCLPNFVPDKCGECADAPSHMSCDCILHKCIEQLCAACAEQKEQSACNEQQLYLCLKPQKCCPCKRKRACKCRAPRIAPQFHDEYII